MNSFIRYLIVKRQMFGDPPISTGIRSGDGRPHLMPLYVSSYMIRVNSVVPPLRQDTQGLVLNLASGLRG
jgi:hypothetical protein